VRAPLISIGIEHRQRPYAVGEPLAGEYQIDAVDAAELRTVELSVLWYTEGKGDEDLGVHHFERWTDEDPEGQPLTELRKFAVRLPNSPLSYEGVLVKLRWCVRVRVFLKNGKEFYAELPFRLGTVPDGRPLEAPPEQASDSESMAVATAAEEEQ
jgi:hypothetical protein